MSICADCQRQGDKAREAYTQPERMQILSAEIVMMRHLLANPNATEKDKLVANSVLTKTILSFEPRLREALIEQLAESSGIRWALKTCPHNIEVLS